MQRHIAPTPGERLLMWRRKKDITIPQAAKLFEVSPKIIKKWEQGDLHNVPYVELYLIMAWQRCFLIRYRNRISLDKMAATMSVDKNTIIRWESGRDQWNRLADYWQSVGWKVDNKYYI